MLTIALGSTFKGPQKFDSIALEKYIDKLRKDLSFC